MRPSFDSILIEIEKVVAGLTRRRIASQKVKVEEDIPQVVVKSFVSSGVGTGGQNVVVVDAAGQSAFEMVETADLPKL